MKHQVLVAKRYFKLKFSCVIPYFLLCRQKKPSKLPRTSVPVIQRLFSMVDPKASGFSDLSFPAPPPTTPDYSFFDLHLSPKIASVDYRTQCLSPDVSFESTRFQKTANVHMVSDENNGKYKVNKKERKKVKVKAMATVSSTDSGCFSFSSELGDEDEETETLISNSRTFSDDSSFELDQSLADGDSPMGIKRNKKKINGKKIMKRLGSYGSKKYKGSSTENGTQWRGSTLKRTMMMMIPLRTAEEKVAESIAVVKKSEDPYEDFKRSMLEMIMEKQMFESKDLEQLLQCFLSLNSKEYHRIIVDAFTEIWEALFCDCSNEFPVGNY